MTRAGILSSMRPMYRQAKLLTNRALGRLPALPVQAHGESLVRLGSDYGGWTFADRPELVGATIISCGAGEDISFDIAFAARFRARVVIVDPTPRAVEHVGKVFASLRRSSGGSPANEQDAAGYDLDGIAEEQLVLLERALWKEKASLRFYAPPNAAHVSHSIVNFQNNYRDRGESIEVEAVTLADVMAQNGIDRLTLLKMDIEGAEIEVIESMAASGLFPDQICVEYDELLRPGRKACARVTHAHRLLLDASYRLIFKDAGGTNLLYVRY